MVRAKISNPKNSLFLSPFITKFDFEKFFFPAVGFRSCLKFWKEKILRNSGFWMLENGSLGEIEDDGGLRLDIKLGFCEGMM